MVGQRPLKSSMMVRIHPSQHNLDVKNITKTNISEVLDYDDSDKYYKCKVSYVTVDGDSDRELKVSTYIVVSAGDVGQAYERVWDDQSYMCAPLEIPSVALTSIFEVYPYLSEEEG